MIELTPVGDSLSWLWFGQHLLSAALWLSERVLVQPSWWKISTVWLLATAVGLDDG